MCDVDYCALCDFLRSRHGRRKSFFCRSPFGVVWRWSGLIFCLWGSDGQFEYFIIYWRLFRSAFFFLAFLFVLSIKELKKLSWREECLMTITCQVWQILWKFFFFSFVHRFIRAFVCVCAHCFINFDARQQSGRLLHSYIITLSQSLTSARPFNSTKSHFRNGFLPLISFEAIFTICARTRHSMWEPQNLSMGNGHDKRNANEGEREQKNRFIKTNEKLAGKIIWAMITH